MDEGRRDELAEWAAATKKIFGVPVRFRKNYRMSDRGLEIIRVEYYVTVVDRDSAREAAS